MPFAPRIRNEILAALDQHVIPALQTRNILQWRAEPPFNFSLLPHWGEQYVPLPDHLHAPSQKLRRWKSERMVSTDFPALGFVYQGASYERVGVTQTTVQEMEEKGLPIPAGITIVKLSAPSIICYPKYSLRSAGSRPDSHWYEKNREEAKVLALHLIGDEVAVFISARSRGKENEGTYPLQINDPLLAQMGRIYLDELRQPDNLQNAQLQLRVFMDRLKRYMLRSRPAISNSCWVDPSINPLTYRDVAPNHRILCEEVMDYIQVHLREHLTLQSIAATFNISPAHLNRIFRQVHKITLMRYVTALRIKIAKKILVDTPERISDVAELVGFSSVTSFSTVFHRAEGCSPSKYREKKRSPN